MIVDPDFLDHWRVVMLVDQLQDDRAPLYILRLWAHCQNRKQTQFKPMPNPGLKALCRYPGEADLLSKSLIECGFIERDDDGGILIVGWAEKNAQLLAAWENGSKGGRPKKNPGKTHGKPMENPAVTDKRREEKSREDKILNIDRSIARPTEKETRKVANQIIDWIGDGRPLRDRDRELFYRAAWIELATGEVYPVVETIRSKMMGANPPKNPCAYLKKSLSMKWENFHDVWDEIEVPTKDVVPA